MRYKILGSTGLNVSVVGFGGIPVQRVDDEKAKEVIIKAEEKGINFIDTARGYSVSEEYIGKALQGRRDKWIIATKSMARSRSAMKTEIETSLKNLKTDYIDLYQLHNVRTQSDYEMVLGKDGAYEALVEAKEDGKIGHIGFTSHSADILKLAIETGKFETIMFPYNIVENQGEELFKRAAELNIGVIAMKPMAGGALSDGRLAIRYILKNSNISCAIPGMAKIEEVEENADAVDDESKFENEQINQIEKIKKELGEVFCRRCGYCAPCPQKIDIPTMFVFKAYMDKYDLKEWSRDRYFSMAARAKDCVECGACEKKCPYNLPIRDMLKQVRKTFNE